MPLTLIPTTVPADYTTLYTINYRAFADEPAILALSPGGLDPSSLATNVAGFAAGIGLGDPHTASAKVIDTASSAIVAFAVIVLYETSPWVHDDDKPGGAKVNFPHIAEPDTRAWVEWLFGTKARRREATPELHAAGPWAYLKALGTVPERQREGAATMLLQWACGVANANGARMMVEASAAAVRYGIYEKTGFNKIDEYTYVDEKTFPHRKATTLVTMVRPERTDR